MQQRDKLFINGKWVAPQGKGVIEVIHSATEAVMGTIPEGSAADAEAAVAAARAAFDDWAATPVTKRAEYIQKIADGLHARSEELAQLIAGEVGMPIKLARAIQVGGPVYNWGNFAKLLSTFEFEEHVGNSLVVREPVGVVGAITPWNYPLNQITLKVAPALAAGCTVVLKPSEVAPLNAFVLAEVIEEAGLPPGVFNLVTGYGPVVGEVLASDPEVDMVSFTGSTRAGKRVAELASQSVKRVALELGGKSASVILDDADLASAVKGTLSACFLNSGQTCSAHTRMLVPRAKYEEVKALPRSLPLPTCRAIRRRNRRAWGRSSLPCSATACWATSARGWRRARNSLPGAPTRRKACPPVTLSSRRSWVTSRPPTPWRAKRSSALC